MNRFREKFYRFSLRTAQTLTLILTGLLLLSGFLSTAYALDMSSQQVLFTWDNPLLMGLSSLFMYLLFSGISLLISKFGNKAHRIYRTLVLLWCLGFSIILIVFSKSVPAGDAYSVYNLAENLALGNHGVIHPTDSYVSYYPQQIGLVAFWEMIIRMVSLLPFDLPAYHFIKLFYGLLGCIIIVFQEKTIHALWQNEKIDCLYLTLAAANCPLLVYTSFVYGEIPSFAALTVGIYFLTTVLTADSQKKNVESTLGYKNLAGKLLPAAGSIFFLTLSVIVRKNSLIFIIAVAIVAFLWGIYRKRYSLLLFTAACILCTTTALPLIEAYYEHRTGNEISSGVTAMSYFAMGTQEAPRANGWYNGFNFNTYRDSGMDSALANEVSKAALVERLDYFTENPGYAATFYLEKYLSQWADGSYACRQATLATFGGRNAFFTSLYEGAHSHALIAYCNAYQNLLYLGAFIFCLVSFGSTSQRPQKATALNASQSGTAASLHLPTYLYLIAVLGGFLFHMIWEANSRYIFPYGLALLPYAAGGLHLLSIRITAFVQALRSTQGKASESQTH